MRRALLTAVLALATMPGSALACRCVGGDIATGYSRAFAVVIGAVESVRAVEPTFVGSGSTATVKISRSWKHDMPASIEVTTQTTCAFEWVAGHTYVLALFRDAGGWFSTAQCLGNAEVPAAALAWLTRHGRPAAVDAK